MLRNLLAAIVCLGISGCGLNEEISGYTGTENILVNSVAGTLLVTGAVAGGLASGAAQGAAAYSSPAPTTFNEAEAIRQSTAQYRHVSDRANQTHSARLKAIGANSNDCVVRGPGQFASKYHNGELVTCSSR